MDYILPPFVYPIPKVKVAPAPPEFPLPQGFDTCEEYLEYLVSQKGIGKCSKEYSDRLSHELEVIKSHKGTANYLLIIFDLIRYAREHLHIYVGPGRSSVAGSLVCYRLGITQIDPLEHNLLFERFISPDRNSLPDIDIDFEVGSREKLVVYLKEVYGDTSVSHIITYIQTRDEARTIVGHGVHASGIAMSKYALSYYTPMSIVDGKEVTVFDGRYIEDVGPIKLDIFELNVLKKIHDIYNLVESSNSIVFDINSIPTDDKGTLEAFRLAKTDGIFMFGSDTVKYYLSQMENTSFKDLVAINAMYRPGTMVLIPEYVARKNGLKEISYDLPCMEKYLKSTFGILIYQEQLMQLVQEIANFSDSESDACRKAIAKKKKPHIAIFYKKFIAGGTCNGYDKVILEKIWTGWCKNAMYLFCKSHAVCCTFIAFQLMYLKVHQHVATETKTHTANGIASKDVEL